MSKIGGPPLELKINQLASDFAAKGYTVVVAPKLTELSIDLGGYRPDLVAKRESEVVVVGVKSSTDRLPVEYYRSIAERIAEQKGWRFVLVTLDEPTDLAPPSLANHVPDWPQLEQRLKVVEEMVQQQLWEPSLLYLWSLAEAALRWRAAALRVPVERFPATRLLGQLYSYGEVSVHEFEDLQKTLEARNRIAHGLSATVESESVKRAVRSVGTLLTRWANEAI